MLLYLGEMVALPFLNLDNNCIPNKFKCNFILCLLGKRKFCGWACILKLCYLSLNHVRHFNSSQKFSLVQRKAEFSFQRKVVVLLHSSMATNGNEEKAQEFVFCTLSSFPRCCFSRRTCVDCTQNTGIFFPLEILFIHILLGNVICSNMSHHPLP